MPHEPPPAGEEVVIRRTLNEHHSGPDISLALVRLLGIDRVVIEIPVRQLIIRASTKGGRGQMSVLVRERPHGPVLAVGPGSEDLVFMCDCDLAALVLRLSGSFLLEEVTVILVGRRARLDAHHDARLDARPDQFLGWPH